MRLLGVVYFFAFLSLAHQVLPLIGGDGLLPAKRYLADRASEGETFLQRPTIFWLGCSDDALVAGSWIGVALSLALAFGLADAIHLFALWAIYLSYVHIGQAFFAFGWESQLLETGFLAIFLVPLLDPRPFPRRAPPTLAIWLLRWLAFRIYLGAGLIKLRGDGVWRDLTALYYHYETQPLPNALSRVLHFAPRWFHQLGCLWNHFVELIVPWFAFWPPRVRRIAGVLLVTFQILLILSGNLSFLNWLTIAPCVACLDDGFWRRVLPKSLVAMADRAKGRAMPSMPLQVASIMLGVAVVLLSFNPILNMLSPRQIMNTSFNPLRIVNTYGAFSSVSKKRNEIILEGSDDGVHWRAYEFKAKPGDVDRRPPIVSPYHYRLDWEIWFAAMSTPDRHPWLLHLVWKLLHNDAGARSLLANDPFPDAPPRFIRGELYRYEFTPPFSGETSYWKRTRVDEWLPPLSKDDCGFRDYVESRGFLRER